MLRKFIRDRNSSVHYVNGVTLTVKCFILVNYGHLKKWVFVNKKETNLVTVQQVLFTARSEISSRIVIN